MSAVENNGQTILVADIGGTNARFAIMDPGGHTVRAETLQVADYPSFDEALDAFLAGGPIRPARAGFAVAGPVTGGRADFTNSPWTIDQQALKSGRGFVSCLVLNDYRALSTYALSPPQDDLVEIKPGRPLAASPVLVLGPGTGLGQSLAVPDGDRAVTVPTEGGHVLLPAATAEEAGLIALMREEVNRPVTVEDVLSGSGMERLCRAIVRRRGEEPQDATAADITNGAKAGVPHFRETIDQFILFLATAASDAALSTGARQGVLIAGGIMPRICDIVLESPFAERFVGDSPMADYLADIPVHLIVAGDAALRGAFMAVRRQISA